MDERIAELERRITRDEDYREIINLMGRYQYLHTGGQMDVIARELFAHELPDATSEYGPLGVFGPGKSVEFLNTMTEIFCAGKQETLPGLLELHQITTPVIEIAGDGKTAKGMWLSVGAILMLNDEQAEEGHSFTWDTGKYAVDFIKLDGVWKVWHLHVCDMWRASFTDDPVANASPSAKWTTQEMIDDYNARAAGGENVRPYGLPIPDHPSTFHYSYASDAPAPREPKPPVPYRTFAETFSY